MLHETVLFDTSPDKCSVLMMCHASLCQQALFLKVNQNATGIFSCLFRQVSLLEEDLLYPSEIAFKSSSVSAEEHDEVRAVGCSEKVAWFSSCLHRCSANVILLSLGACVCLGMGLVFSYATKGELPSSSLQLWPMQKDCMDAVPEQKQKKRTKQYNYACSGRGILFYSFNTIRMY